jgi:hypothetical protein
MMGILGTAFKSGTILRFKYNELDSGFKYRGNEYIHYILSRSDTYMCKHKE